jgi:hypothetical protein
LQQPFGQVMLLQAHVPLVVSQSLGVQVVQALPPMPHCEFDSIPSVMHVLPLQQPFEHEAGSHTHWPLLGLHS